jgi:hypothetical protein
MSIQDVIERVRRELPYAPPEDSFPDLRMVCKILEPIDWDRSKIERDLGVEVPTDLGPAGERATPRHDEQRPHGDLGRSHMLASRGAAASR